MSAVAYRVAETEPPSGRLGAEPVRRPPSARLTSLDALRALAIAGMLLVNNMPGGGEPPGWFVHAKWDGLHAADLVFPWFLFVVGVSMAISLRRRASTRSRAVEWLHFAARVTVLFALGLGLNYLAYGLPLRVPGVLQRIALASLLATPFARMRMRWVLGAAAGALLLHSAMLFVPLPGLAGGVWNAEQTFAYWLDMTVLGVDHIHRSGVDPEGLLGVIPSAGQVLLGVAVGRVLIEHPRDRRTLLALAGAGVAAILVGWALSPWLPIVKKLWTASFVLVTSGTALLVLLALYMVADVLGGKRWVAWLVPMGRNALALYVGSRLLSIWLRDTPAALTEVGGASIAATLAAGSLAAFGAMWGPVIYAAAHVLLWYAVAAVLDHSRIYVKL